jgi:hypothetical protein
MMEFGGPISSKIQRHGISMEFELRMHGIDRILKSLEYYFAPVLISVSLCFSLRVRKVKKTRKMTDYLAAHDKFGKEDDIIGVVSPMVLKRR